MRFINLGMPARRAKQACLHCRGRKIRCDLAFGGSPCLNCRLDEVHCEVRGRKPKRRRLDTKTATVTIKTNIDSTTTIPDNIWIQDGMFTTDNDSSLGVYQFSSSNPSPCHLDNVQIESTDARSNGELEPVDNRLAFINDPDLSQLPPDDVGFLRQQGCLSVPPRPILDEFIREYFLHFVSESVTKELGFESPRLAAARLYQRAKLLYVFDIEPSTVDLARGALLLTFLPVSLGSDHPTPNSVWLTRAIKHAESLGASHAGHINGADTGSLKRLWWCCILRDRSISLGQRRCVQISGHYPLPAEDDFRSEFNGSLVYTSHIKAQLFRVFRRLIALSYTVGDLLQLMARHRNASHHLETVCADDHAILSTCREDLSTWFSATGEDFLGLGHGSQQRHPSVIVYTNFVYIQYYTAKLLLHHQKLIADVGLCDLNESLTSALIDEVRSSTFRFIDHLSEPVRLGLARFLPISVAVFAAVPMAMHVFEARLGGQTTANQRRLRILIEMLEAHQPRFEGIEPLSLLVRQTVTSVESGLTSQRKGCLRSWTDVIAYQPYQYLNCGSMPNSSWSAMMEYCRRPTELGIPSSVSDAVEGLESIHSLGSLDFVMKTDGTNASLSEQESFDLCSLDWDPFSSMDIEDEEPDSSEDRVDLLDEILNDL
ncbi:fungal specific transcription factor domain-containing protein [Fusarium pseudocircinatum]|uniref:Fungal specific transcription factor domain-containing protein n=1 Tax=Fusarium pseudocircinatum TaxID=56676 RepID=A0A8H5P7X1_9HYPO|nr:fungal specific transcription factor domain-containing protein [Fusarium pseudocircinatum]